MSDQTIRAALRKADRLRREADKHEAEAEARASVAAYLRREADRIEAAAREGGG